MKFFPSVVFLCPAVCLLAQAPPKPAAPTQVAPGASQNRSPAVPPSGPQGAAVPLSSASKPLPEVPPDKVVITVGEEKITAGELSRIIQALPEQFRASASSGPGRKQFIDNYVRVKVMAQEGRRRKLDQDPTYLAQLSLQRDNLLAGVLYNTLSQSTTITDEQVKQYYDQHKNEFENVRASHILIRFKGSPATVRPGQKDLTEEEALAKAQALRKEILAGGDFAAIAKRDSDDAGSGVQGGDLGTFHRGQMVPSFEEVAFTLPVGQISEPVKTMFGYHLIKVASRDAKKLEDARAEIEKKLRPEAAMKAVDTLQKSMNVVIDPQYLGEAPK